jgi:nucleoside-diphosphate-sugar epimerase|tara:strand:- start:34 stop:927 length:894 start_codon:yes stop_codon:yes gene_type:complete
MSNVILFGGSGFFGPAILEKNSNIISVGRNRPPSDLKNKHIHIDSLDNLSELDSIEFDKVIFLVGSSNHDEINKKTTMGFDYNVYPLIKVLSYLENRNIKKFICFTSILLYDQNKIKLPVDEMQPINPYVNKYVLSKHLSEDIVEYYSKKVPSIVVRLSNIYGPTKLKRPDIIHTIMQNIFKNKEIRMWNSKPKRDFIFVEDAANAILHLINSNFTGKVNLGSGKMHEIKEITDIMENLSGKKITFDEKSVSGPMEFVADIDKIKKITGWKPKFSLEEGLKKTYEIMKKFNIDEKSK